MKIIGKNREEITNNISHKLKFIDSAKFMTIQLPNLVNNLPEKIHKIKRKYRHDNAKRMELNTKIVIVVLTT